MAHDIDPPLQHGYLYVGVWLHLQGWGYSCRQIVLRPGNPDSDAVEMFRSAHATPRSILNGLRVCVGNEVTQGYLDYITKTQYCIDIFDTAVH